MPFRCDDNRTDRWALETLDELMTISKSSKFPSVEIVPTLVLKRNSSAATVEDFASDDYNMDGKSIKSDNIPDWATDPRLQFQHLSTEMLSWQNNVHKLRIPSATTLLNAGYNFCWLFRPPIVDTEVMLKVGFIVFFRLMQLCLCSPTKRKCLTKSGAIPSLILSMSILVNTINAYKKWLTKQGNLAVTL